MMQTRDIIRAVLAEVDHHLKPIVNRVRLTIGRGVLHLVNDAAAVQQVQATFLAGETRDGVERPQNYGFTSVPLPGMEPVAVFLGGDRSQGIVVAVADRQYRLKGLPAGEVALYDDLGQRVHLSRTGVVVDTPFDITATAGGKARVHAKDIEQHASRSLSWDIDGYGQRITSLGGGAYKITTWQQGAQVQTEMLPIKPPEGP